MYTPHQHFVLTFLALFISLCTCTVANTPPQTILSLQNTKYTFRNATYHDIHAITTILIDAFVPGAAWRYIRPEWPKYRNYTWHCLRAEIERQWKDYDRTSTWAKVITVPGVKGHGREGEEKERVVSVGVWNLKRNGSEPANSGLMGVLAVCNALALGPRIDANQKFGDRDCTANLGVNRTRAVDSQRQLGAIQRKYIDTAYDKQLYLNLLATHPDWDGHGFAAENLAWGMKFAERLRVPVTLIATPAGYPLYDNNGFESLANVSVETLDGWGGGRLWFEVMKHV